MVDERARATCADTIHALLRRIAEIRDFGILAAKLNHGIGLRNQILHRCRTGNDLLHEGQADALGDPHTRRACESKAERLCPDDIFEMRQILLQSMANFRKMAGVVLIENMFLMIEHHQLDGRRAYVNTYSQ